MDSNKDTISIGQLIFILILTMIGTGVLTLPRDLADEVPYDHLIVLIVGGLIATLALISHAAIIRLRPHKSFFEILCDALTKPIAYLIGSAYILHSLIFAGLITRIFGEIIKVYLLRNTPIEVVNIGILITCVYASRKGIKILGRMMEFVSPFLIVGTVVIFGISLYETNFSNLLPVFQISFLDILKATPVTLLSFIGFEKILFFGGNLKEPKKTTKAIIAVMAVLLVYIVVVVSTLARFGTTQTKHLVWPAMALFDTVELPGLFLENIQAIVMSVWVIIVFTTIAPIYLGAVMMLQSLTKSKDQAYLAAPFLPIIYMISIITGNMASTYEVMSTFNKYFSSIMIFGIPIIVLISLLIQEKLKKGERSNA